MAETLGETLGDTRSTDGKPSETVEEAQLIIALECDRPLSGSSRHSLGGVNAVSLGRGEERGAHRGDNRLLNIQIPDRWMSSAHARMVNSFGRWILHDEGSKNGTLVNGAPVTRQALSDGDLVELGHTMLLFRERVLVDRAQSPDTHFEPDPGGEKMNTLVPDLERQLSGLAQLATSPLPVLLLGESGTGKEVVARAIHRSSERPGAFVAVNCGAIPATLIESELFGHRKGAFSGAVADSPGLIRSADKGTLFLDEIADLPAASQAAMLRVLQEREVRPVGATATVAVDLRLVSATHRNLDGMVRSGEFREDLFARIAGFRMRLPPLRERREDLGLLVGSLLARTMGDAAEKLSISCEAARLMFAYGWPRNIRQLENCLHAATVLASGEHIHPEHLPAELREQAAGVAEPVVAPTLSQQELAHREELIAQLRAHGGNISAVAREIGKDRKQIHRWLKRYGLRPDDFRV